MFNKLAWALHFGEPANISRSLRFRDGGEELDDDAVILGSLHALLNLSTESNNQAQIGKYGISKLVAFSHDESAPNLRGFSTRIIANLLRNGENRTALYRQELSHKAQQWAGEVVQTEEQVKEYERRQMQRFDSHLNLKVRRACVSCSSVASGSRCTAPRSTTGRVHRCRGRQASLYRLGRLVG